MLFLARTVFITALTLSCGPLVLTVDTAAQVPDNYVITPDAVKFNDDMLGNVADAFAESIPIWASSADIPIADYQMMVLHDGTALAATCWDEYGLLDYDTSGQLIACIFQGLPGSTGATSITGGLELIT